MRSGTGIGTGTRTGSIRPTGYALKERQLMSRIGNEEIGRRRLTRLVVLCLAVPVVAGFFYALDALVDAPWAYPVFGSPTLTGAWMGEFTVPSGARFALL